MFDLTSHIRSWRDNLAAEGVYSPSDLDELESHLREAVVELTKQDLSEQEALAVACLRLGDKKGLNREFTKALGRELGRPTVFPLPAVAARLLFGEMADALLLSSARVLPERLKRMAFRFDHPDLETALRAALCTQA